MRIPAGTSQADFSVYDQAGTDHKDVFVFDDNEQEVDSTVSSNLDHAAPAGGLYIADDEALAEIRVDPGR